MSSALKRAGGSIVGSRFLELDYRLELQRLRLDVRDGNLVAARQHLHRNKHTRDLLLQLVPSAARQAFSRRIAFDALESAQDALVARQRECVIERSVPGETHFGMVGRSPAMLAVFAVIEELRAHEVPVLISGEPGTGKELVARALHEVSARASGAFMALHCGSLPEELFESELFGYEAGAFTGAEEARE
ncbi:MAG: sigma 54-interacting transcriptional regulator, partial [Planctomycetes bacterium]|nr:sigma 54-interacting transcriptional regulator [Planctomycetota bacterium]